MKTNGYIEALKGWQMDNGQILSIPPEAKEVDVIAEAERLEKIANTPPVVVVVDIEKEFSEAVDKYVSAGGKQAVTIVSAKVGTAPVGGVK